MASFEVREHLVADGVLRGLIAASASQTSRRTTSAVQSAIRAASDGTVALLSYSADNLGRNCAAAKR